jgi:PleD family two-component response regulator
LGAAGFLPKPVDADQLLQLIGGGGTAPDSIPPVDPAEPPGLADRAALVAAFAAGRDTSRALALVGAAEPSADQGDAIERIGDQLVGSVSQEAIVARWNADHVAVLFPSDDLAAARGSIEQANQALSSSGTGALRLAAGIVDFEPQATLDETFNQAGHLLYLAQNSLDLAVITSVEDVPTPTIEVLLAEDDEVAAKLLIYRMTRESGFAVTHCGDGIEALEAARRCRFQLGIFDVNMPGMDGFDLLARLREMPEYSDVPIIMLTSLGSEKDVVRGLQLGANDYVVKPFSPAELLARVRRLLAGTGVT